MIQVAAKEFSGTCQIAQDIVDLPDLNPELPYHRLYCYAETLRTNPVADYFVKGEVKLFRNRTPLARFPAEVGQDTANTLLSTTLLNMFPTLGFVAVSQSNVPSIAVQEYVTICLSKTFSLNNNVLLGHVKADGSFDRMTYSVLGCGAQVGYGIISFRVWLGILSSDQPF